MTFRISFLAAAPIVWAAVSFAQDAVPLDADIVVMGELHDVAAHHANQAEWVSRMEPAALVFEMLSPALAEVAGASRGADDLGALLEWEARGWPDFAMYAPIFDAAGAAAIYGAEVASDDLSRAVADGAAAVLGDDATRYGVDLPLPLEEQDDREALQDDAHCNALPPEMLAGMVEAQRLRDAVLARAAVQALEETGGPVAVITGNGHARRDWGVPLHIGFAAPEASVISIGQLVADEPGAPYDAVVLTADRTDRGDPCDAFN